MTTPWFERLKARLGARRDPADPADVRLAMAVLLHEVARADFDQVPLETEQLLAEIGDTFALSPAEAEALRRASAETAARTVSLHHLLDTLNAELDPDQKRALLASLWRVAWADGSVDPQEEALIRRLADLLYIPHAVFVQERLRAQDDASRAQ
jgi:uncharacterized tellurite resistance protein B-like protein